MPRYDDHHNGNTRLYVGHLSSRIHSSDIEYLFSKYGRVCDVKLKFGYAFVEFSDPRDADDARCMLDGYVLDGAPIVVEFSRGGLRGAGGSRDYAGRGPPPGTGRCFNCGIDGHWARDCKAGDRKNKCYRCGERGHIERNCQNSPKNLSRSRSQRRDRRDDRRERSRSWEDRRSPRARSPVKSRKHIISPAENHGRSRSPMAKGRDDRNGDSNPRRDVSRSPSPADRRKDASPATNGRSPSPRDGDNNHAGNNRGSESPEN